MHMCIRKFPLGNGGGNFQPFLAKHGKNKKERKKKNIGKASIYGDFEIFDFSIFENFVFSETGVCTPQSTSPADPPPPFLKTHNWLKIRGLQRFFFVRGSFQKAKKPYFKPF